MPESLGHTLCIPRLSGECTTGVIPHIKSLAIDVTGNLAGRFVCPCYDQLSVFTSVMIRLSPIYYKYAS